MLRVLPDWTIELEEKLDKVIKDLAAKNNIDLVMVSDSKEIEKGMDLISNVLLRLYDHYGIEDRKRLEKFERSIKKTEKKGEKDDKK